MDQAIQVGIDTSTVMELRQYTLHPGKRDTLIELFEGKFIDEHTALGMPVIGPFRDAGDPNRFVFMRGFRDMPARGRALESFYGGPVWKANREAANATMIDSDNVLMLRPIGDAEASLAKRMTSLMVATIYLLQAPVDDAFVRYFDQHVVPAMVEAGSPPIARFRTEYAENNYPRLPIRTGENAFVWFSAFGSHAEYDRYLARLAGLASWSGEQAELAKRLKSPPVKLQLEPTQTALERHVPPYAYTTELTGDLHDFDFIAGDWTLEHRRLKARGAGSNDWSEFSSASRGQVFLGGVTNVDENHFPTMGWSGMTFRHFDLEKKQWSIYWINTRDGKMQSPVMGGFDGDVGLFYGEDEDGGRPVKVVFRWTKMGPNAARWEQAFSYDGGKSWETNWTNELIRR